MKEERQFQRTIRVHGFISKQKQLKSNAILRYFAKRQILEDLAKVEEAKNEVQATQSPSNENKEAKSNERQPFSVIQMLNNKLEEKKQEETGPVKIKQIKHRLLKKQQDNELPMILE